MKITIIGAGYIGTRLWETLFADGHELSVIDNNCLLTNIGTKNYVGRYQDKYHILNESDLIIYLAGYSSVSASNKAQLSDVYGENVTSVIHLLNYIKNDIPIIYASSAGVYGCSAGGICDESFVHFKPINSYDMTKWFVDMYANFLKRPLTFGLRFGTVNGYSPVFRRDIMLNKMCLDAQEKGQIKASNTYLYRPILGISDLCTAFQKMIRVIEVNPEHALSGVYNLASGNWTVSELAGAAGNVFSVPVTRVATAGTQSGYDMRVDCTKFRESFGWEPTQTPHSICVQIKERLHDIRLIVDRS
jgi:nucleoside-diphosphate-sugar epimerase